MSVATAFLLLGIRIFDVDMLRALLHGCPSEVVWSWHLCDAFICIRSRIAACDGFC